jgi:hypothetical protein
MKKYFATALVQLIGLSTFAMTVFSQEVLITSPGTYTATGGCLSVQVKLPDPDHVDYRIEWKLVHIDEMGHTIKHEWTLGFLSQPLSVARDRWAFCMVSSNELWVYDGRIAYMYKKGTSTGIGPNTCPDPKIGEQAPGALKQWVSKNPK